MVIEGNSAKTIKGFIAINEFYYFNIINYSHTNNTLYFSLFYNKILLYKVILFLQ